MSLNITSADLLRNATTTAAIFCTMLMSACTWSHVEQGPRDLEYAPAFEQVSEGTAVQSPVPTVEGNPPYSFSVTVNPPQAQSAVTIDSAGVIRVDSTLAAGEYRFTVSVEGAGGLNSFPGAYFLQINASNSSEAISFNTHIRPIVIAKCGSCHTGGPNVDYTSYQNTVRNADIFLNRVQRAAGTQGFMPRNRAPLPASEIALIAQWITDGKLP